MMVFLPWSCRRISVLTPIRWLGQKGPSRPGLGRKCLLIASLGAVFWGILPLGFNLPDSLESGPRQSPRILDRHGVLLDDIPRADFFRHQPVSLGEIPPALLDATLVAQDKRFFDDKESLFIYTEMFRTAGTKNAPPTVRQSRAAKRA